MVPNLAAPTVVMKAEWMVEVMGGIMVVMMAEEKVG